MTQNSTPNDNGPPMIQPINTATKIIPVTARWIKILHINASMVYASLFSNKGIFSS